MLNVIRKHITEVEKIDENLVPDAMITAAQMAWSDALELGQQVGFRNAQVTVLAPTGTISFMMDCDTTGIEPELALIKYKHLAGGGSLKMINGTVPEALSRLGYSDEEQQAILEYLETKETIEGAPHLKAEHLPVFDCAFPPKHGKRVIHYMGHLKMMAATQPFISGGISKTVNVPHSATVEDIKNAYIEAWKMGIKAVAIYRDGSKRMQPLTTSKSQSKPEPERIIEYKPVRRPLPNERAAITKKFSVAGHKGYVTVGMYEDGTPGELFIVMSKEGSTISGLMDGFATAISLALQYGVPLDVLVNKFAHMRFEPSGFTGDKEIPIAKSILDYIFRWLALKFQPPQDRPSVLTEMPSIAQNGHAEALLELQTQMEFRVAEAERRVFQEQADAPPCSVCGAIMVRSGTCYKCLNCGTTSGCS
ncbi:ribonucleoside-diphosphate reductase, adenosylcobalamin-dependent [Candidatus Moduliflexus flocculans]|uniref:Vitamin B12-dependent ribonucleotide reductase n=1 Tax=Candidatus Moduliflexus flocculans TaxID=1499966 RepID=A0A0S6VS46_9BACT|nr:ribonucleoside-diphosphate reductase, adenosylcobalamin-dependent [Candidatus Moduliflexus flocculans]